MRKLFLCFCCLVLSMTLLACGQKGNLYLPKSGELTQTEESEPKTNNDVSED